MLILSLLTGLATAAEVHVFRSGDSIESVATQIGDPTMAPTIRELNGLQTGEQPPVGTVLTLPDTDAISQPGQVLTVSGTGSLTPPGGGAPQPLVEGAFLIVGTTVCTGPDSYAAVRLASVSDCSDEDDITMLPETCLVLDSATARPDRRSSVVSVTSGSVRIGATDGGTAVAVRTPAGITTGESGGFRVAVEETSTRSEAVTGDVAVLAQGTETEVARGFGVRTPDGAVPGDLVKLLPPGTPILPDAGARLLVPDFAWTPVPRALGYRVELAEGPDMVSLVRRTEVGPPKWSPTQLFLPYDVTTLHWHIIPFDRLGFEGIPSEVRPVRFPRGVGDAPGVKEGAGGE